MTHTPKVLRSRKTAGGYSGPDTSLAAEKSKGGSAAISDLFPDHNNGLAKGSRENWSLIIRRLLAPTCS